MTAANTLDLCNSIETVKQYQIIRQMKRMTQNEHIGTSNGDMIDLHASEHSIRFLRFQEPGYFYQRLLSIMDNNPAAGNKKS